VEKLSKERRAPWRKPLRGGNRSVESSSSWRESPRGEKVFVENLSEERRAPRREMKVYFVECIARKWDQSVRYASYSYELIGTQFQTLFILLRDESGTIRGAGA
jgi:hypothetical protein